MVLPFLPVFFSLLFFSGFVGLAVTFVPIGDVITGTSRKVVISFNESVQWYGGSCFPLQVYCSYLWPSSVHNVHLKALLNVLRNVENRISTVLSEFDFTKHF